MILILHGHFLTGKTTHLKEWAATRTDVGGLLTTRFQLDHRKLYSIANAQEHRLEATQNETFQEVGRYRFSDKVMEWGNDYLLEQWAVPEHNFWVVDELGLLELEEKGFYRAVKHVLDNYTGQKHLIFVVRQQKIKEIMAFFEMDRFEVKRFPVRKKEMLTTFAGNLLEQEQ